MAEPGAGERSGLEDLLWLILSIVHRKLRPRRRMKDRGCCLGKTIWSHLQLKSQSVCELKRAGRRGWEQEGVRAGGCRSRARIKNKSRVKKWVPGEMPNEKNREGITRYQPCHNYSAWSLAHTMPPTFTATLRDKNYVQ